MHCSRTQCIPSNRMRHVLLAQRLGDTGAHSKELAKATEAELLSIDAMVAKNKGAVIAGLLMAVETVSA